MYVETASWSNAVLPMLVATFAIAIEPMLFTHSVYKMFCASRFLCLPLAHSLQFSSSISITCETPLRLKCEIAMWKSWSWRWRTTFIYKPVINIVSALKNRNCGIMVHFWHATLLAYRIHVYSVCIIEPCINNNITHTHTQLTPHTVSVAKVL